MEMSRVSENIRFLRRQHGWTQEQFAEKVGIKRSLVGAYEEGRADPRLNTLFSIAQVFDISVDILISENASKLSNDELYSRSGQGLKVLSITVDSDEEENIELVPLKASAGYLNGYADPEYLEDLPKFKLPILPDSGTYRAFEISGDSMLPLQPGTIIVGKYLESLEDIKNGRTYVLITRTEGIVYKRVFNYLKENGKLFLVSDNGSYTPYEIAGEDVLEVWEAKAFISMQFPDPGDKEEMTLDKLAEIVMDLQKEVIKLKQ